MKNDIERLAAPHEARTRVDPRYAAAVEALAEALAATAAERDRAGGSAKAERDRLRRSGLLTLAVPKRYGGPGESWTVVLGVVRRLAEVDSSLAHLFAFQHLQVATVLLYGSEAQKADYLTRTVAEGWFWGNALNPLDTRLKATRTDGGWRLDGVKSFCSGATDSDRLIVSALPDGADAPLVGVLPTTRAGIEVKEDWDAIGQRQTDSGSVMFTSVELEDAAVLAEPGPASSPFATLRTPIAQLILANLYLGIGIGAFEEAKRYVLTQTRPWPTSGAAAAAEDPYIVQRFGNLWLQLRAAQALADAAAARLDTAWSRGLALDADERGELAVAIAEAKLLSARAGLAVAEQLFDAAGARAVSGRLGLDRFWRNVRTHSLHDSLDYKLKEVGDWALNGRRPTPSLYS